MKMLAAVLVGVSAALGSGAVTGTDVMPGRWFDRASTRAEARRSWLEEAGLEVGVGMFTAASLTIALTSLFLVTAISGSPSVAIVPAVSAGLLPRAYYGRRRSQRARQAQAAWPHALRDILGAIRAGATLSQAVGELGTTGPDPLRQAFARFPQLARVLGVGPALDVVRDELSDATSDRVLEVLVLAQERGGATVARILEDLVSSTTDDVKLLEEIDTENLEMRINARAVVVMPWAVLVVLTARAGPFRAFYQRPAGLATLMVGGALTLLGIAILARLSRDVAEPRVFSGPSASGVHA